MPCFANVIGGAYQEILRRAPDPSGLASFNALMNQGLSEAQMREALLRSAEFAANNPGPGLASRVGLNVHIPSNQILDDVAVELGMRWMRVDFDWFRIEPERGAFRFEEFDRLVARATDRGLELLAILAYTPDWASSASNPRISDPPASVGFWTDVVRALVGRYRDRVRYWQLWNEPNVTDFWTGSMRQYRTEILEAGAAAARAVHAGVQIVSPGLANIRDWRDWFSEVALARAVIDVVNHHNYQSSGREVVLELERDQPGRPSLRTLMRQLGLDAKPFWLTETGRRSDQGNQRQYYQDVLAVLQESTWVDRLFFFHYWDGPGRGNGGFGIVNEDFSPKPAYQVLRQALRPVTVSPSSATTG